jgi:hypothetical protein
MYRKPAHTKDTRHGFCVHHQELMPIEEMEPLENGEPSDCCRECWRPIKAMLNEISLFYSRRWIAEADRAGRKQYGEEENYL